jgi:hypothetical protein
MVNLDIGMAFEEWRQLNETYRAFSTERTSYFVGSDALKTSSSFNVSGRRFSIPV